MQLKKYLTNNFLSPEERVIIEAYINIGIENSKDKEKNNMLDSMSQVYMTYLEANNFKIKPGPSPRIVHNKLHKL